jgi:hypothetical protein
MNDSLENQRKKELKETQCKFLFAYLIDIGKFNLIELMAKSDRHEIHTIRINSKLVPNVVYHNTIINYLKRNGVEIIYPRGPI